jgi:RHS repeat-associated protein
VVEYYHLDALGTVRAVTNQAGEAVERHDYLPYGEEWCGTAPCPAPTQGQPLRFTGKERDVETGLDYFGARYYGSKIGRFTTVDPVYTWQENLVDPQRWNRYAYARNNPLRYVDPDGRLTLPASLVMVTTANPPGLAGNRLDTAMGVLEGVLTTVVPGLEIQANSPDQAAGQIMGQLFALGAGTGLASRTGPSTGVRPIGRFLQGEDVAEVAANARAGVAEGCCGARLGRELSGVPDGARVRIEPPKE